MTPPARLRLPGVTPLEVWDLPVGNERLWQLVGSARLETLAATGRRVSNIVAGFLEAIRAAWPGLCGRAGVAPSRLLLAGGLTGLPGFAEAASSMLGALARVAVLPGGAHGALAAGAPDELVLDIGQTAAKAGLGARRLTLPRDAACPVIVVERQATMTAAERESAGAAAEAFFTRCLKHALSLGTPRRILLGLPVELDDELVPGACTYAGLAGRRGLVRAMVEGAGALAPLLACNDAELAALAARNLGMAGPGTTLLLTLGFGPGAARLESP